MATARAEVERTLPHPPERVAALAADPGRFDAWVEPLNRLVPLGDGTYLADIGYFGQPNEHRMRAIAGTEVGLEALDREAVLRWTVSLAGEGDRTRVRLVYEKGGSGTVFGASTESPLFAISIEVLAERSLERLGRALEVG